MDLHQIMFIPFKLKKSIQIVLEDHLLNTSLNNLGQTFERKTNCKGKVFIHYLIFSFMA